MPSVKATSDHGEASKAIVGALEVTAEVPDSEWCLQKLRLLCKRFCPTLFFASLSHSASSSRTQGGQLLLNARGGRRLLELQDKFY